LAKRLRKKGFQEDSSDVAPLCRWRSGNLILDIMPTDTGILGFGSKWYRKAFENVTSIKLFTGRTIKMVSPAYFLMTKLEAFEGRGNNDYLLSHDMEDIIAVIDGRPELLDDLKTIDSQLLNEISKRFRVLLNDNRFIESISGHMEPNEAGQARVLRIVETIKKISDMS
jgi:hypothetical protein